MPGALHSMLERQLVRLGLDPDTPTHDPQKWKEFIEKVNKTYAEADQERYLLERSMELSSNELLDLNRKLENAQHVAHLGYWHYDKSRDEIFLSKELYLIFGLDQKDPVPRFSQFMQMVDEEHRSQLQELIDRAFSKGLDYEYEFRMKRPDGEYRWYSVVGHPFLNDKVVSLTGVTIDITERKKSEEEVAILNQQLVEAARKAGMADIASSTLHNVGNVLNTANISTELLQEYIGSPYYKKLFTVIGMLKENLPILSDYLTQDAKGKLIPHYLITLSEFIEKDYENFIQEITNLKKQIQHIKDIVSTQQDISHVAGVTEKVQLPQLLESALRMSSTSNKFKDIKILKEFEDIQWTITDKTKLLQLLVNLIQNAKESLVEDTKNKKKKIIVSLKKALQDNKILISIEDNGVGIIQENLTKIFSFGFTTKENGHGYGLHSAGLAAQELGGTLSVESEGAGKGAVFILTLPSQTTSQLSNKKS